MYVKRADSVLPSHYLPLAAEWSGEHKLHSRRRLAALIGWYRFRGPIPRGTGPSPNCSQSETANPGHCTSTIRQPAYPGQCGIHRIPPHRQRMARTRISGHHMAPNKMMRAMIAQTLLALCPNIKNCVARRCLRMATMPRYQRLSGAHLIDADGHRRTNGREAFIHESEVTTDKNPQVQAVAARLGYSTTLTPRTCGRGYRWTTVCCPDERQWRQLADMHPVQFSKSGGIHWH